MQIGGIGSGNPDYGRQGISHQITDCIHDHGTAGTKTGAVGMSAPAVSFSSAVQATEAKQPAAQETVTLWGRVRDVLGNGRQLLGRIWGQNASGEASAAQEAGELLQETLREDAVDAVRENALEVLSEDREHHESRVAAAASAVQAPQGMVASNPYFTVTSDTGKVKEPLLVRIRIRFRDITGYLSRYAGGRLAGRFSKGSNLTGGRNKPRQDLRKQSRYREKGVEMDCVLTDDSHLMDSYDSTGKYSRLGTENRR